jgi:hypothetical protein
MNLRFLEVDRPDGTADEPARAYLIALDVRRRGEISESLRILEPYESQDTLPNPPVEPIGGSDLFDFVIRLDVGEVHRVVFGAGDDSWLLVRGFRDTGAPGRRLEHQAALNDWALRP